MTKKKKRKARSIIAGHLEKIGSEVFEDYKSVITDLIRGNQGIYALFKKDRLYYVGLARNLKSRINAHTKDGHQNKWTHFSLYIIRKEDHIKEIESLVLRISYPKGNKVRGKLKQSKDLRPLLKNRLIEEWEKRLGGIIGGRSKPAGRIKKRKINKTNERPLQGYFQQGKVIYANYKDKECKAWVYRNGRIKFNGNFFDSPSMAGIAVTKKKKINGWRFWKYKDKTGELVCIDTLRK
ncbi:MAG: GIY-YIG nuclease family protein [Phycisphaerae bacterium]|nr:GIY-YIG nuclease family protein [Phycisphaerae bacterium]